MPREGSVAQLLADARALFQKIRMLHVILGLALLGTGIASTLLSQDPNGNAQVPYFFSAYIAAVWHVLFLVICYVCIYYLKEEGRQTRTAVAWVNAYTISSSLFVLFNVMGTVFAVVNGICLQGMQCYYDHNETANRTMAIILILLHCVSILSSVFLAKRTHLIDSELRNDVSIKLNHVFDFSHTRHRQRSVESSVTNTLGSSSYFGSQASLKSENINEAQTNNNQAGAVTTVTTSVAIHTQRTRQLRKRSKSHPNLAAQKSDLKHPDKIEGTVVSIYSDTDMKPRDNQKKRGRMPHVRSNKVSPTSTTSKTNSTEKLSVPSDEKAKSGWLTSSDEEELASQNPELSLAERKRHIHKANKKKKKKSSKRKKHSRKEVDDNVFSEPAVNSDGVIEDNESVQWNDNDKEDSIRKDKLLKKQLLLQREQEALLKQQKQLQEEQRQLFLAQQNHVNQDVATPSTQEAPPPYEALDKADRMEEVNDVVVVKEAAPEGDVGNEANSNC